MFIHIFCVTLLQIVVCDCLKFYLATEKNNMDTAIYSKYDGLGGCFKLRSDGNIAQKTFHKVF